VGVLALVGGTIGARAPQAPAVAVADGVAVPADCVACPESNAVAAVVVMVVDWGGRKGGRERGREREEQKMKP